MSKYYLYKKKTKSCETVYKNCKWRGGAYGVISSKKVCNGVKCTSGRMGSNCSTSSTPGWTCSCNSHENCWWSSYSSWSTGIHCPGYQNSSTCKQKSKGKYYK